MRRTSTTSLSELDLIRDCHYPPPFRNPPLKLSLCREPQLLRIRSLSPQLDSSQASFRLLPSSATVFLQSVIHMHNIKAIDIVRNFSDSTVFPGAGFLGVILDVTPECGTVAPVVEVCADAPGPARPGGSYLITSWSATFWHILQLAQLCREHSRLLSTVHAFTGAYEYARLILAQHDARPDTQAMYADRASTQIHIKSSPPFAPGPYHFLFLEISRTQTLHPQTINSHRLTNNVLHRALYSGSS